MIILNCFRYLDFKSLYDIEILTIYEYTMRMKAFNLSQVDKQYDMATQAWMNHQVTATKETGSGKNKKQEPIYREFKDFFDYEQSIKKVENPTKKLNKKEKRMAQAAKNLNSKGG